MFPLSNNSQNSAIVNFQNSQVFFDNKVNNSAKVLNFFEKRNLLREKSSRLLRRKAACVYAVFNFFFDKANNETGEAWHSVETIANNIGYSARSVNRATNELHKLKLILKKQRGRNKKGISLTNLYKVNWGLVDCDPPCKQPNTVEATSYVRQSSLLKEESNFNDVIIKNVNKIKKKKPYPNDIIDSNMYFPTGKAFEILNKLTTSASWDVYLSDARFFIKDKEKELGRPLKRFEANYASCFSFNMTKKLWSRHNERYIRYEIRSKYKQKQGSIIEINKRLSQEALKTFCKEELDYYNKLGNVL